MALAVTVAIIAGGKSSRMGTDKSFVHVRSRPLIEDILAQVDGLGAETIIITNQPASYAYLGVPHFPDVLPEMGALGGIYSALYHSSQPHTLCLACDMPFVVRPLLDYLLTLIPEGDVIVPRLMVEGNAEAEPFRAVYARTCLGPICAALEAGRRRVISFFPDVRVRYVDEPEINRFDPQHLSFFNINTPADLERARQLASSLG
ncbi:MAG: molybdenum cofactor guanylyltransferase [Anaerolineales bacterium]|nr:molybdenum cofactor guanylyltransferase [Anaerolineales bacterium]